MFQPAEEDIFQENMFKEPQSEIGFDLSFLTIDHIGMFTVHNTFFNFFHKIFM